MKPFPRACSTRSEAGGFAGDEAVADDGAGGGATVCAIGMVCLVDAPNQCVQREPGQLVEIDGDGAQRGGGVRTFGDAVEPDDSDVRRRAQADIDVVLADPQTKRILLGECTWRNSFNETEAVEALLGRERLIPGYDDTRFMFSASIRCPTPPAIGMPVRWTSSPPRNCIGADDKTCAVVESLTVAGSVGEGVLDRLVLGFGDRQDRAVALLDPAEVDVIGRRPIQRVA